MPPWNENQLSPGKALVSCEDDQRIVVLPGFLECLDQLTDAFVEGQHTLLVLAHPTVQIAAVDASTGTLLARGAAMRFLLTRLYDWLNTPPEAMVTRKDPLEFIDKLRFHQRLKGPGEYGLD